MTQRLPVPPAPGPLEAYCQQFDPLFDQRNQRDGFRRCLEGLLLPTERTKTLTALANTEPVVGAQHPHAQSLQWFLSESTWDPEVVNKRRIAVLRADPVTAPIEHGVLVIDEHGDRTWGSKTAHVGKQYLANLGKIDTGVVSVTSLWADEHLYYPLDVEPYTPAHHFPHGTTDPAFRTKLTIGVTLVRRAVDAGIPFRAVVADSFYGEDHGFQQGMDELGVGYVLALKPSHAWWHPIGTIGSPQEAAAAARWTGPKDPGDWVRVERSYRDGHRETWWAFEVQTGPYGRTKPRRAIVVTADPATLPERATWYLLTNLPAPGSERARAEGALPAADLAEMVRLYGLRMWVEQSYKQTKGALGWSDYQVRADIAIRRHWTLVCCAFCFCWYHHSRSPWSGTQPAATEPVDDDRTGGEKNQPCPIPAAAAPLLAGGPSRRAGLAGAVDHALALLERVVEQAPATPTPDAA
jgi:SRSO17 transposase